MFSKHAIAVFIVAGCAGNPSTGDHSVGFRFEVEVNVGSDIDSVTVNGEGVPINSGIVDAVADYRDYSEGMTSSPLEFEFRSNGAVVYVGHAVAGACQDICAQQNCPDLFMFKHELVTETAGNFAVHTFECVTCVGPSANIYSCP